MVIKNLENKIKLVTIICSMFLVGCILISISSIWTARSMVVDAQNKIYVLDGNVPILVQRTTMEETLDIEAKSHIERFHTSSSHWLLMTNISSTPWRKPCISWMKQDWPSTTP